MENNFITAEVAISKTVMVAPLVETKAQIAYVKSLTEKTYLATRIPWLLAHNGLRPSKMHLFIGPAGGGKSSVMFSMVLDMIENNVEKFKSGGKILIYLSEESANDFQIALVAMGLCGKAAKIADYIRVISESDLKGVISVENNTVPDISTSVILRKIGAFLGEIEPVAFIIDNITTTDPYLCDRHEEISPMAKGLQLLCRAFRIPFLVFAHTTGQITGPQFSLEDIRQKKTICNISEFAYLIHRFLGTNMQTYIEVRKSRGFNSAVYYYKSKYCTDRKIMTHYFNSTKGEYQESLKTYKEGSHA